MIGFKVCKCKTLMRPRWTRMRPKLFLCTKCGKCVPGYEELWIAAERLREQEKNSI